MEINKNVKCPILFYYFCYSYKNYITIMKMGYIIYPYAAPLGIIYHRT